MARRVNFTRNNKLKTSTLRQVDGNKTSPPICYATSSSSKSDVERVTESELRLIFGARKLKHWKFLEQVGTGLKVVDDGKPTISLPEMANIPATRQTNPHNGQTNHSIPWA